MAADVLMKVDAVDVFQGQEVDAVGLSEFIKPDNIFVAKLGKSDRFLSKSLQRGWVLRQAGQENFEGHVFVRFLIGRLINNSHSTRGDMGLEAILPDVAPHICLR